jgi:GAF domain-containing protein
MSENEKTKEQLAEELAQARRRIAELEAPETGREQTEQSERLIVQLSAWHEISTAIASCLTPEDIFDTVVQNLSDTFDYRLIGIYILEGDVLELKASAGYGSLPEPSTARVPLERGVIGRTARTGQPQLITDVEQDPDFFTDVSGVTSEVCVPLVKEDTILGVLNVESDNVDKPLDALDLQLFTLLSNHIVAALENARLYEAARRELAERKRAEEEVQRRASQAALIYEVGQRVSGELELDELLSAIVTAICDAFDYYNVGLFLLDEGAGYLTLRALAGTYADDPIAKDLRIDVEEGLVGHAAKTGKTQVSNDTSADPHYVSKADEETRSELAVPIQSGQTVIGVLDIQSDQCDAFDEADVAMMETLCVQMATAIENARLFEEARNRARRMAVINRIAGAASATLHLDDLMERVYQEIASTFQPDAFFIALYDEAAQEVDVRFQVDEGVRGTPQRFPLGVGLTSIVITEKRPLIIQDEQERDRLLSSGQLFGTMKPPVSWLGVPMLVGEQVIGIVNVQAYRPHAWSEEDKQLLFTIADQVAVALENARLFQERERRVAEMEIINQVGQAVTSVLDPDAVLHQIVDMIKSRFDHYYVYLVLTEGDELVPKCGSVVGDSDVRLDGLERLRLDLTEDIGLVTEAARTGQPVLVHDTLDDPRYFVVEALPDTRSELDVPIRAKGRVIGVLGVQSDRPYAYTQADVELVQSLASQAGIAIENARLFEEARVRAEELAVLNELGQALTARLSVEEVMEEAYRQAGRLVDTTNFFIGLYDPEKDEINFAFQATESEIDREKLVTLPADRGVSGHLIRSRTSVLIRGNLQEWQEETGVQMVGEPALSWLGVPLMIGDRMLGVMAVQSYTNPHLYDEHARELMIAIANQTAIALQNAQMVESLEQMVEERTADLRQSLKERERLQQEVIEAQKRAIQELSTPIIPITDHIIVMPLIGSIDTLRAKDVMRALLAGIREHQAKVVILDVTGVPIVDSGVANHLNKTIQAARLKGAHTIVTGISDAVAETIVDLGIDWSGIETLSDLRTGLVVALNSLGVKLIR